MSNDLIEFVDFIFDRYAFLELEPTATRGEIEAAITDRRAKNHPDRTRHLDPALQDKAAATWAIVDKCAEVLLDDALRPSYDERLAYFKEEKPELVTNSPEPNIIFLERDFIDVDLLASGGTPDASVFFDITAMATGYDQQAF